MDPLLKPIGGGKAPKRRSKSTKKVIKVKKISTRPKSVKPKSIVKRVVKKASVQHKKKPAKRTDNVRTLLKQLNMLSSRAKAILKK